MPELHRTNINLYASDVAYFQKRYGYGWTERVRDIVHEYVTKPLSVNIDEPYTEVVKPKFLFSNLEEAMIEPALDKLNDLIKEQSDD